MSGSKDSCDLPTKIPRRSSQSPEENQPGLAENSTLGLSGGIDLLRDIEKRLPVGADHDSDLFDLSGIPTGQLSPPFADVIPMDTEFSHIPILSGFVRNILHRQITLTVKAWRRIINFCTANHFEDDSSRIGLQLLFIFSKADPVELEELYFPYSTLFDIFISPHLVSFRAELMNDDEMNKIKQFLLLPVTLKTFKQCLDQVLEESFQLSTISTAISSMRVFKANNKFPLRGATLHNGIFMNFFNLCNIDIIEINDADCFTLACHETCHYLARKLTNNFNYSSPFTGRSIGNTRTEDGTEKKLELGRMFEVRLLGFQPNWLESKRQAAKRFLTLVHDESSTVPLNIGPGLVAREKPSPSFGIDLFIKPHFVFC